MQDTVNMAESEFDEEEEPPFSDQEDFVDDIDDEGRGCSEIRCSRGLYARQSPCTSQLNLL